jgi:hypothetical protein
MGACSEPDPNQECGDTIVTRANPSTDFSMISTFAVVPEADYPADLPSDLPSDTKTNIFAANEAARSALIAQGLTEVDPAVEDPDVWLFSLAATETDTGYAWECVPGYVWWGWFWAWDSCAWLAEVPVDYEIGTVIIGLAEVSDDTTGEIVFGGAVQGVLDCDSPRERVEAAVEKIFAQYPG